MNAESPHLNNPLESGSEAHLAQTGAISIQTSWEGPLPAPQVLAQYDEILPGAADRILKMAETEQRHSHDQENKSLETARIAVVSASRQSYLGIAAGFIISLLVIGGSIYLISEGHGWEGLVLGGIDLVALVGVFIYGTQSRRANRAGYAENG